MADVNELLTRLAALELEQARHRDLWAIHDLLTRYSRALDWLDAPMLEAVFYDDADIDYGFFKGSGRDFKPLLMSIERAAGRRWHFTAQLAIDLQGEVAHVDSYNLSVATEAASSLPPAELGHFYGYYQDRLLKRDGRWGIIARRHLLVGAESLREVPPEGALSTLNTIGYAAPDHACFRRLGDATPLKSA